MGASAARVEERCADVRRAPPFKYFQKVADGVDVAPLLAQLEQHPELWGQINYRRQAPGSPHTGMQDIWLRYNDLRPFEARGGILKGLNDEHDSVWYPSARKLPAIRDIIFPLMSVVDGERLGGVLITKIPAGCGIDPHTDGGWHVNYYDKFYLSLKSAPGADLCCGDEALNPKVGEIWRFDNRLKHWVVNESNEDRMTLIICIRTEMFNVPAA